MLQPREEPSQTRIGLEYLVRFRSRQNMTKGVVWFLFVEFTERKEVCEILTINKMTRTSYKDERLWTGSCSP